MRCRPVSHARNPRAAARAMLTLHPASRSLALAFPAMAADETVEVRNQCHERSESVRFCARNAPGAVHFCVHCAHFGIGFSKGVTPNSWLRPPGVAGAATDEPVDSKNRWHEWSESVFFCAWNAPHSVHFCVESVRSGISLSDVGGYLVADVVSGRTDRAPKRQGR